MPDDSKIRPFRLKPTRRRELLQGPAKPKMGLYPLSEDVVMSLPLFALVLTYLERGTTEQQKALAEQLRESFGAPYA